MCALGGGINWTEGLQKYDIWVNLYVGSVQGLPIQVRARQRSWLLATTCICCKQSQTERVSHLITPPLTTPNQPRPPQDGGSLYGTWIHQRMQTAKSGVRRPSRALKKLISMIIPEMGNSPGNSGGFLQAIVVTRWGERVILEECCSNFLLI